MVVEEKQVRAQLNSREIANNYAPEAYKASAEEANLLPSESSLYLVHYEKVHLGAKLALMLVISGLYCSLQHTSILPAHPYCSPFLCIAILYHHFLFGATLSSAKALPLSRSNTDFSCRFKS